MHGDLFALDSIDIGLNEFDACFFCLGVPAAGLTEGACTRLTYHLTLSIARVLVSLNPSMTFVYVSGAGTDAIRQGRPMWARVKGRSENALLDLPFKAAVYLFGPGPSSRFMGRSRRTRPMLGCFKDFRCTRIILGGIETMHMIAKGQMKSHRRTPLSAPHSNSISWSHKTAHPPAGLVQPCVLIATKPLVRGL